MKLNKKKLKKMVWFFLIFPLVMLIVFHSTYVAAELPPDDLHAVNIDSVWHKTYCASGSSTTSNSGVASGKVFMIGDSITDATNTLLDPTLKAKGFSNVVLNSHFSRRLSEGPDIYLDGISILEKNASQFSDASAVIIELGTNNGVTADNIKKTIDFIKQTASNAKIYWVNIGVDNSKRNPPPLDGAGTNNILQQNTGDGYTIIDWATQVKLHPEYIDPNPNTGLGVHPIGPGKQAFADTVANGVASGSGSNGASGGTGTGNATPANGITMPTAQNDKIEQTFIVGFDTNSVSTSTVATFIQNHPYIGGIFFIGDPPSHGFDSTFLTSLQQKAKVPLIIASDEEGGSVQRFAKNPAVGVFDSAGKMGTQDKNTVQAVGAKVGQGLKSIGLNVDLAPVLDTYKNIANSDNIVPGDTSPAKSRSFGTSGGPLEDTQNIIDKAGAFAAGLNGAGVKPVYKHFPGLGQVPGNTDNGPVTLPSLSGPIGDLKPYQALANQNSAAIMLSNAFEPDWNGGSVPVSISKDAVNYLRTSPGLSFQGLITTDALGAITTYQSRRGNYSGNLPQAITDALDAGVDMPLFTYSSDADIDKAVALAAADPVASANISGALGHITTFKTGFAGTNTTSSSCCPTNNTSASTLVGSDPRHQAWNYLIGKGLTPPQAAGIMGNLEDESSFDPKVVEPGYGFPHEMDTIPPPVGPQGQPGYGIVQWTSPGRKKGLGDFAVSTNRAVYDLSLQLDYMWSELSTSYKASSLDPLMRTNDVTQAATIIAINYEGGVPGTRVISARQYLADFGSGTAQGSPSVSPTAAANCSGSATTTSTGILKMFDSTQLVPNPGGVDTAAGYLSGHGQTRAWTAGDWSQAKSAYGHLLPIYVAYSSFATPNPDADSAVAQSKTIGLTSGSAIALDIEAGVASQAASTGYVSSWATQIKADGFVPMIYTSKSTSSVVPSGILDWIAYTSSGAVLDGHAAHQYSFQGTYDLSVVDASKVPLWATGAPVISSGL